MLGDNLRFRRLIRNMRRMEEAGQLITCPVCKLKVLTINTRGGKCLWHEEDDHAAE